MPNTNPPSEEREKSAPASASAPGELLSAVCPHCFQMGQITSWQGGGMWQVRVNPVQRAVVTLHDGTRASGLLECSSAPCIRSQAGMQSRPVSDDAVVVATLRAFHEAEPPERGEAPNESQVT